MDPACVLLLEVNQLSTGKRMAFCLLSGEFVLVSDDAAEQFGAATPLELVGQNLLPLVVPYDAEKLQDLARQAECGMTGYDGATQLQLATMARVARTGGMLWIRVLSVPVSLRLMRCMESLTQLRSLTRFADASSFVLSDDELVSTGSASDKFSHVQSMRNCSCEYGCRCECGTEEDGFFDIQDPSVHGPLELKSCKANAISAASPTSAKEAEEEEHLASRSLASYAFDADWMSEDEGSDPISSS